MALDQPKVDDTFDDVMAAYKELQGKSDDPAPATNDQPSLTDAEAARSPAPDRDELGNFKQEASEDGEEAVTAGEGDQVDDEPGSDKTAADAPEADLSAADDKAPPPSWTVKSKSAWDKLPAEVKADIAKREREVSAGLAELRDYKDLKPYAALAKQNNTTLSAALQHYTGMERLIRKDLGGGLAQIVQNYGLNQQQAAQLFTQLAQKYGGQPTTGQPNTHAQQNGAMPKPGDPLYEVLKPIIEPLQNELQNLRQSVTSRETADRNASEQSLAKAIETFSTKPENRYFSELEETISRLFETRMVPLTGNHESDLRTAYDLAAQMVPEVREALIDQRVREQTEAKRKKDREAADKAKNASRSITGSRVPGTVNGDPRPATGIRDDDIEADVRAAYRLHSQY